MPCSGAPALGTALQAGAAAGRCGSGRSGCSAHLGIPPQQALVWGGRVEHLAGIFLDGGSHLRGGGPWSNGQIGPKEQVAARQNFR